MDKLKVGAQMKAAKGKLISRSVYLGALNLCLLLLILRNVTATYVMVLMLFYRENKVENN